jgi:hypothetical protein
LFDGPLEPLGLLEIYFAKFTNYGGKAGTFQRFFHHPKRIFVFQ